MGLAVVEPTKGKRILLAMMGRMMRLSVPESKLRDLGERTCGKSPPILFDGCEVKNITTKTYQKSCVLTWNREFHFSNNAILRAKHKSNLARSCRRKRFLCHVHRHTKRATYRLEPDCLNSCLRLRFFSTMTQMDSWGIFSDDFLFLVVFVVPPISWA